MPKMPTIKTALPGPKAKQLIKLDKSYVSPSYTRVYPLVVDQAEGLWVHDVDGNVFLDFTAGIAVNATGHCHPHVVKAIQRQAGKLLHMSGTDFYYTPQIQLAEKLASLVRMALKSEGATLIVEGAVATSGDAVAKPVLSTPLHENDRVIEAYAFMAYQVRSVQGDLADEGQAFFKSGE